MPHNSTVEALSTPVDARILKSRAKLREALLALVRVQKFEAVTIADITATAGVGYATFHRHYADKQELWREIAEGLMTDLLARIAPFLRDGDPRDIARGLCAHVVANREVISAILAQGAESTVRADLMRRALALSDLSASRDYGGLPRSLVVKHATDATVGILTWWLERFDEVPADQMVEIVDRLVIRPVTTG
jgi:AcrR family transcriptional regulator